MLFRSNTTTKPTIPLQAAITSPAHKIWASLLRLFMMESKTQLPRTGSIHCHTLPPLRVDTYKGRIRSHLTLNRTLAKASYRSTHSTLNRSGYPLVRLMLSNFAHFSPSQRISLQNAQLGYESDLPRSRAVLRAFVISTCR